MIPKSEIKIGLKFKKDTGRKKDNKVYTIEDIYKTYNSKNEIVKIRYVISCDYIGQKLYDYDTSIVTIQRSIKIE